MWWSKLITVLTLASYVLAKPYEHQHQHLHQHQRGRSARSIGHSHVQKRAAGGDSYTVTEGDTGNLIAAVYSITFAQLSKANPNVNWYSLQIGQVLSMPSARRPYAYTVASGDTRDSIAQRYNIYTDDLVDANPSIASGLPPASNLRIPAYGTYTTYRVASGDYGYAISAAFGISFDSLSAANPGVTWNNLQIGQVLTIPAGVSPVKGSLPSSAKPPKSSATTTVATASSSNQPLWAPMTTTMVTTTRPSTVSTIQLQTSSTMSLGSTISKTRLSSSATATFSLNPTTPLSTRISSTTSSVPSSTISSITRLASSTYLTSTVATTKTYSSATVSSFSYGTTSSASTSAVIGGGEPSVSPTTVVAGANYVAGGNDNDGVASRADSYTMYQGDGSKGAGWPSKSEWISFTTMWKNVSPFLGTQCQSLFGVANNSPQENQYIYNAIQAVASKSGVDHRLILATIIQESSGCVRVKTTISPDGSVTNPGLMQDFNGSGSCNKNGNIQNPCPATQIYQMIEDGTFGTNTSGSNTYSGGLVQDINSCTGYSDAQAIYRAARTYNSGSVPSDNNLGGPGATRCYASDIANRLMGWVSAKKSCTLDG